MLTNSLYSSAFYGNAQIIKAMKHSFFLKTDYKNKDGKYPLYLNLYIHGQRKRVPVDIYLKKTEWDQKRQVVKPAEMNDLNLLINEIKAQINKIEIQFRLNNQVLTVEKCVELIKRPDLSIDFIPFMEYEMNLKSMTDGARKNQKVILAKLKEFRSSILFGEINDKFILKYRRFLIYNKGNSEVTVDSNVKIVKHYIKIAKKRGYQINIDVEDIKIKQHKSHRTNLNLEEVERMKEYLFSTFISDAHKKSLGYFLFNCMTGLRIEDLRKLKRQDLNDDYFNFWNQKSKKQQVLKTNITCKKILDNDESLFINPITAKTINETIQDIAKFLGIRKHLSNHIARHTFATNYLRKGGKIEDLQVLLGHSNIKVTMIYAHIVEDEVVETLHLLD
ncbi:site-specific integrase [Chryseobacterium arthrosphaerae]|uniref:site-specific integrase n=1 Tax=Chryseobacterium arthrosphaerae TaxID=651561 RepID=UPI00241D6506|nr:site-specific integrase [Chryseobacterium arthrosphaerae]